MSTDTHPADSHDLIRVHGARENNLKDISVEIPKRRLTVFTGVSGSGKSSLVFDTIAADSQRMINETYSAFVQGFMPTLARPDVDVLDGLTTAIIVDQERMGANPRSTVGTATDANAMLRILFSRLGQPAHRLAPGVLVQRRLDQRRRRGHHRARRPRDRRSGAASPSLGGMCPRCEGTGTVNDIDLTQLYDDEPSRSTRARSRSPATAWTAGTAGSSGAAASSTRDKPIREVHQAGAARPPLQGADQDQDRGHQPDLRGPDPADPEVVPLQGRRGDAAAHPGVRRACRHLHDLPRLRRHPAERGRPVVDDRRASTSPTPARCRSATWPSGCAGSTSRRSRRCSTTLRSILDSFVDIGLGYLSLDRPSGTLSGGEAQRTKMIRHLGSSLTDVTYVFDEPTIGLHPHDIQRMNAAAAGAARQGQHGARRRAQARDDRRSPTTSSTSARAPGTAGGTICFEGTVEDLRASGTLTGRHLDDRASVQGRRSARPSGTLEIRGATANNLRDVDVDIPLGVLVVITGVAGSGKSSLVHGSIPAGDGVVSIDQGAISGSRRSNPATYTGLLEPDPQGVRQGQRRQAGPVQRQLRGRVPRLQRRGRHLHRPRR